MRIRCPHFAETFARLETDCARVVERFDCRLDVPFGESALERLDIWPGGGSSPILLFIHGGYWRAFDKSMFRFVAERFVEAGACVVLNNYDLCPNVTMDTITEQNRRALAWIWGHAADIGGDRARIHVTGHSAGGHLTAMLLATDWSGYGLAGGADPERLCAERSLRPRAASPFLPQCGPSHGRGDDPPQQPHPPPAGFRSGADHRRRRRGDRRVPPPVPELRRRVARRAGSRASTWRCSTSTTSTSPRSTSGSRARSPARSSSRWTSLTASEAAPRTDEKCLMPTVVIRNSVASCGLLPRALHPEGRSERITGR